MKKVVIFLASISLLLFFTACSPAETISPSSPPPSPSPSPLPTPSEVYIPDVQDTGGYIANSGCSLYEDEDYLAFKNDNGIYIYSKTKSEITDVLPRCTAFTYYSGKVYYTGYDVGNKKRYIEEYDPAYGTENRVAEMDNEIVSMLISGGRLYYSYQTDPDKKTVTELRSIDLNGGDMRVLGAQGVDKFCVAGNYVYYVRVEYNSPVCRLNTVTGDDEQVTPETSFPNIFEVKGDLLYYCDDNKRYVEEFNLETGTIDSTGAVVDWDSDFALLGQYIVYIDKSDLSEIPAGLYIYDMGTNISYKLAELEFTFYNIHTTEHGVYICPYDNFGCCRLYRLGIQDGKAALEEVLNYDPYKQVSSDTVVIADSGGQIYGGYAEGKWITPTDAVQYCRHEVLLHEYSLAGFVDTVESTGAKYESYADGVASSTIDMDPGICEYDSFYTLNIPDSEYIREEPEYPLNCTYLYTAGPDRLPEMEVVADTSEIQPKIQKLLDKNFGKGKVRANISIAVIVDIDNDGKKEIIVNAGNNGACDESDYDKLSDWYSLACIIRSNGSVYVISESYCSDGYPEDSEYVHVQNIIDIDGDGNYEIVAELIGYEWSVIGVYKYDGKGLTEVLNHNYGS